MSILGIVGDGVMGTNLAQNLASKGHSTIVYGHHKQRIENMLASYQGNNLQGTIHMDEFYSSQKGQKTIFLLVPADAVDQAIEEALPYLQQGDILCDLGNSFYEDTIKRQVSLSHQDISYLGIGISGGSDGARYGPSIMPSGNAKALAKIMPILEDIAAKDFHRRPCVTNLGDQGQGHFIKMAHNGIEYAIMDMISSIYHILRDGYNLSNKEIAHIFESLNTGLRTSFLLETAIVALEKKDSDGSDLIDHIADTSGQKGTGLWAAETGLRHSTPTESISGAIFERFLSNKKALRVTLANEYQCKSHHCPKKSNFLTALTGAFLAGSTLAFAEGFSLISQVSKDMNWDISIAEVSRIWQGGCIIRMNLLDELEQSFTGNHASNHFLQAPRIKLILENTMHDLRMVVQSCVACSIPCRSLTNSLSFFDTITDMRTGSNLTAAMRDIFGGHGYMRSEGSELSYTDWKS